MKYALIDTFWGWLARPILLWNLNDICTVVLEIIVIKTWFKPVRKYFEYLFKRMNGVGGVLSERK